MLQSKSMPRRKKISVCMATYNGAGYVKEQILSILTQLTPEDELIICDDRSCDDTVAVVKSVTCHVTNVIIHVNSIQVGYIKNFEQAIHRASGELIMLADQDDIWEIDRVEKMVSNHQPNCLIIGNFRNFKDSQLINGKILDENLLRLDGCESKFKMDNEILAIILGTKYFYGCTFLFNKYDFSRIVYPFPRWIISHDIWIALCFAILGRVTRLSTVVTSRRIHPNNVTNIQRPLLLKLFTRIRMFGECSLILIRLILFKNVVNSVIKS